MGKGNPLLDNTNIKKKLIEKIKQTIVMCDYEKKELRYDKYLALITLESGWRREKIVEILHNLFLTGFYKISEGRIILLQTDGGENNGSS